MASTSVGEVIAQRYELLEVVGHGGQGQVFRAKDSLCGREVAVKVIEGRTAKSPDTIERLAREQQAMIALAGTAAVEFLDMCTAPNGALCLVMELLEGQDLETFLVQQENLGERLSVSQLMDVLEPVISTLDRAHAVGILHRDLKPGNIFMISKERGGGSRLLDFGFARLSDSKRVTATGMVMGSPSYIAPEMWKGQGKTADHRVDIYAMGVIIFRALAGQLPFSNRSMQETLVAVTTAPRPSLHALRPDLPPAVDEWVKRVLAVNVDDRFSSMKQTWGHLMWRLGAAPPPAAPAGGTVPPPELDKIRLWLLEPPSERHYSAQGVWASAAATLKRLIGGSAPSPKQAEPSRLIEVVKTSPPPQRPKGPLPAPRRVGAPIKTSPPPLPAQRKVIDAGSLPAPKQGSPRLDPPTGNAAQAQQRTGPPRPPRPRGAVEASNAALETASEKLEMEDSAAPLNERPCDDASSIATPSKSRAGGATASDGAPNTGQLQQADRGSTRRDKRTERKRGNRKTPRPNTSAAGDSPVSPAKHDATKGKPAQPAPLPKLGKPKWKRRRHRKSK